ncbi:hypothetical protein EfsSzw1_165 [Enterococcus phage EfsSzw-1]|uniref:Uncharacterized protein n=1 Tax=Enterococcus phage EfsSzw-1 TaxID=2419745 RepID=A0A411B7N3_9CAUD|nr:hypothetical protein EfsSzw1_165 [Enterococcus phage EfsSzw-1]
MNSIYILLAIMYVFEFGQAFLNTKRKERYMIEDGGEPLPRSSYVFLFIQYVLRTLFAILLIFTVPENLQFNVGGITAFIVVLLVIPFISRFIEVGIRVLIIKYLQAKHIKRIKEQGDEKETN